MGSGRGQLLNHSPVTGLGQADSHGLGCLGSSDPCPWWGYSTHAEQQSLLPVCPVCFSPQPEGTRTQISVHTSISQSVIHEQQGHPKKPVSLAVFATKDLTTWVFELPQQPVLHCLGTATLQVWY